MSYKFIAIFSAACLLFSRSIEAADEVIVKIGFAGPLSGSSAHIGKDIENGARMAINELNANSTTIGGKRAKFILFPEDDAGDPKQAVAVAYKLVDARINAIVGHVTSSCSVAASRIYSNAGVPQISPSTTSMAYGAKQNKGSTFRLVANDRQIGDALGRFVVTTIRPKTIAVIDDGTAFGQGFANEFIKTVKKNSTSTMFAQRQHTNDKASDFYAILTSIKASQPDLIFFGGMDTVAGLMLRQIKSLSIKAKFIVGESVCTKAMFDFAGNAMNDRQVICAERGDTAELVKQRREHFDAKYKKEFGKDPSLYAPNSYDAVMVFADAMKQAKSTDPVKYLPFLRNTHFDGVTANIDFDSNGNLKEGHSNRFTFNFYTYESGKRIDLQ